VYKAVMKPYTGGSTMVSLSPTPEVRFSCSVPTRANDIALRSSP
jgi:hypothetical protein